MSHFQIHILVVVGGDDPQFVEAWSTSARLHIHSYDLLLPNTGGLLFQTNNANKIESLEKTESDLLHLD